jgi:hypothetical protein
VSILGPVGKGQMTVAPNAEHRFARAPPLYSSPSSQHRYRRELRIHTSTRAYAINKHFREHLVVTLVRVHVIQLKVRRSAQSTSLSSKYVAQLKGYCSYERRCTCYSVGASSLALFLALSAQRSVVGGACSAPLL